MFPKRLKKPNRKRIRPNRIRRRRGQAQRETAKERRERDKAYKQRLREEAETHKKSADEAEARRARILDAGKQISAPVEKDFDDYTEFVAAKAVWRHAQQATERDANEAFTEAEAARQRAEAIRQQEKQYTDQAWGEQIKDAQSRYTDFEAVAFDQSVPITDQMAEIIKSSDMGADLAYYLGKNKAIAADIAKMQPIEAARVMGRIEATLSAPALEQKPKPPTRLRLSVARPLRRKTRRKCPMRNTRQRGQRAPLDKDLGYA